MESTKERIQNRNKEIARLQAEQAEDEKRLFEEAQTGGFIDMLNNVEFESSAYETDQYRAFYRIFRPEFTKILKRELGVTKIQFHKNHFEVYGFFELPNGNIWFFNLGDLRWHTTFLVRTAKDFKDYTGGSNQYLKFDSKEAFLISLKNTIH